MPGKKQSPHNLRDWTVSRIGQFLHLRVQIVE
jgi:hypothetical protein